MIRLRRLVILFVLAALVFGGVVLAAGAVPVSKLILSAAEVGPGYKLFTVPGGNGVGPSHPTLDLCGYEYSSEALRTSRLQVGYTNATKPTLSNEVVRYRIIDGKPGTVLAMIQIKYAVTHCPNKPRLNQYSGQLVTERYTVLKVPKLLPGSIAVVKKSTVKGEKPAVAVAIYQTDGPVLSAIYSQADASLAAQKAASILAAQAAATKLKALLG